MATLLRIHPAHVKDSFENDPRLLPNDREPLFNLPTWADVLAVRLHTDVSRLGFVLQLAGPPFRFAGR